MRRYGVHARSSAALEEEPHVNTHTGTSEFALRDPDGYYVMVSEISPDAGKASPLRSRSPRGAG